MIVKDIELYVEQHRREYITDKFEFASYHAPNTMYSVSNDLDEILLTMSYHAIKVWHRTMSLIKRNTDPVKACTIKMSYDDYKDIVSRNYFYKAVRELSDGALIYETNRRGVYVINILFANKLFKPKLDIPEE